MTKTAIMYSPLYLEHNTGPNHPDTPDRLELIIQELNKSGLLEASKCTMVTPKLATKRDLQLVHSSAHIEIVNKTCKFGGGLLDSGDTVVSTKSFKAAVLAVGAAIDAVSMVANGNVRNAFALVRPPGHHAGPNYALGFCLFNNIAVAAAHILRRLNYRRVLILDLDAHHGNGTQEIFYNTDKVLYIGIHQDPRGWPGTGFADECGEGQGIGYNVNIPLPFGVDDRIYQEAFNQIAVPIINQYKPQFFLISAGFDGHYTDPVAQLSLSIQGYSKVFSEVLNLASQLCKGRMVAALEGGYNLTFIGKIVVSTIARMAGCKYNSSDKKPISNLKTRGKAEKYIDKIKKIQASFWRL